MKISMIAALAASALAITACATAPVEPIPFVVTEQNASVSLSNVRTRGWAKDDSILLETNRGEWYRAVLMGGCTNAHPSFAIGFETDLGDTVDRGSEAILGGQACPLASFDKIEPPPEGSRQ